VELRLQPTSATAPPVPPNPPISPRLLRHSAALPCLVLIAKRERRQVDLVSHLRGRFAVRTISDSLVALEAAGLVERSLLTSPARGVSYTPTRLGLQIAHGSLFQFMDQLLP